MEEISRLIGIKSEIKKIKQIKRYQILVEEIVRLINLKQLYIEEDITTFSPRQLIYCNYSKLDMFRNKKKNILKNKYRYGGFILLNREELSLLLYSNRDRNPLQELLVYTYIKSKIKPTNKDHDVKVNPEYYCMVNEEIIKKYGYAQSKLKDIINNLSEDLNLIRYKKVQNIQLEEKSYFNLKTVYVLQHEHAEQELKYSIQKYMTYIKVKTQDSGRR